NVTATARERPLVPATRISSWLTRSTRSDERTPGIGLADSQRTYRPRGTRPCWTGSSVVHASAYSLAAICAIVARRKATGSPGDGDGSSARATATVAIADAVAVISRASPNFLSMVTRRGSEARRTGFVVPITVTLSPRSHTPRPGLRSIHAHRALRRRRRLVRRALCATSGSRRRSAATRRPRAGALRGPRLRHGLPPRDAPRPRLDRHRRRPLRRSAPNRARSRGRLRRDRPGGRGRAPLRGLRVLTRLLRLYPHRLRGLREGAA